MITRAGDTHDGTGTGIGIGIASRTSKDLKHCEIGPVFILDTGQ